MLKLQVRRARTKALTCKGELSLRPFGRECPEIPKEGPRRRIRPPLAGVRALHCQVTNVNL